MFEEVGFLALRTRGHVNKCAPCIEGVTPHNFTYIRSRPLAAFGSFRDGPVDSLFVVNTLENIQIIQSFGDNRLLC